MNLSELKPSEKSRKRRKIVGRGQGSGHGKTSARGGKGQTARAGASFKRGTEGGQTPLYRRLPKRGFNNPFKKIYAIVNISDYNVFKDGQEVKPEQLAEQGIIRSTKLPLKVLADGELNVKCKIFACKFSKTAQEKIVKAGGEAITMGEKS